MNERPEIIIENTLTTVGDSPTCSGYLRCRTSPATCRNTWAPSRAILEIIPPLPQILKEAPPFEQQPFRRKVVIYAVHNTTNKGQRKILKFKIMTKENLIVDPRKSTPEEFAEGVRPVQS